MSTASSQLLKTAVYQDRLMSREGLLQRLFSRWFNGFVYNQIWEDPKVDLQALDLKDDSQILTIASGGCNILNYLIEKPKRLVAVDLNRLWQAIARVGRPGSRIIFRTASSQSPIETALPTELRTRFVYEKELKLCISKIVQRSMVVSIFTIYQRHK
ncbi:S-adenosylmethionine:diacylglycerol 3-amino-3-carboxypropyl transferase protein [Candidatus Thiomargarita nelsonii]|uniref:S-adenosylmethionine:diacylglycerol 3-amino-3-carboxypropyl transferase protein n=1 Tax=Candidatus Thiomargarita nelsonii TaxID=1003181 RepID=A0A176S711_9GAMM|nr:S-adenosylmethionine:diacylglycerol 3-amino-3-carboxypropyl transferase protein [Candidatus Thiomargarita nelsonii]